MALIPLTEYPGQTDGADPGYPAGKARNASTFQDGTGTPVERAWINDLWGFLQSLLVAADITPTGDPDEVGASQYLEAVQDLVATESLRVNALRLRELRLSGTTIDDTAESMAAVCQGPAQQTVLIKVNTTGVLLASDGVDRFQLGGAIASITSDVCDAAHDGAGRIVAIGTGGNRSSISVNGGSTWSAGGLIEAVPLRIVWNQPNSRFLVCRAGASGNVSHSSNGAAWSAVATGLDDVFGGLAVLVGGETIACGSDAGAANDPVFAVSTNGGTSWALTGGTVANPTDYDDTGSVAGRGIAHIWHVGRLSSGAELRVNRSAAGAVWELQQTFTPPAGATFNARPRILCCQNTGLLVVAAPMSVGGVGVTALYASKDAGVTWRGPMHVAWSNTGTSMFAAAGGRLFATRDAAIFGSDGIGFG